MLVINSMFVDYRLYVSQFDSMSAYCKRYVYSLKSMSLAFLSLSFKQWKSMYEDIQSDFVGSDFAEPPVLLCVFAVW